MLVFIIACSISFMAYEDYKEIWTQRTKRSESQMNLVTLSTKKAVFYNEENAVVATLTEGVLNSTSEKVDEVGAIWHNGEAITPDVTVRIGEIVLKRNEDYYLDYINNVDPGTATIFIVGTGNYKSLSEDVTFEIVPAKGKEYTINSVKYQMKTISAQNKEGTVAIVGYEKTNKSITIKNTVKIGNYKFKVIEIKKNAFKNCSCLKSSISIGNSVTTIGDNAFYGCKTLKKVKFGKNVKSIGKNAFYKCTSLSNVTFSSDKITKIEKNAFKKNKKSRVFYYPKGKKTYFKKLLKNQ